MIESSSIFLISQALQSFHFHSQYFHSSHNKSYYHLTISNLTILSLTLPSSTHHYKTHEHPIPMSALPPPIRTSRTNLLLLSPLRQLNRKSQVRCALAFPTRLPVPSTTWKPHYSEPATKSIPKSMWIAYTTQANSLSHVPDIAVKFFNTLQPWQRSLIIRATFDFRDNLDVSNGCRISGLQIDDWVHFFSCPRTSTVEGEDFALCHSPGRPHLVDCLPTSGLRTITIDVSGLCRRLKMTVEPWMIEDTAAYKKSGRD